MKIHRHDAAPGYQQVEGPAASGFAHDGVAAWVEDALSEGTLYERALATAERQHQGRGAVPIIRIGETLCAVRHFRRGGFIGRALSDQYLRWGEPRPFRELRASHTVRDRGISTPRVVAGAVHRSGFYYRADLITDYIPEGMSLGELLFDRDRPAEDRVSGLESAGHLIERMAGSGLYHRDLNANNLLLTGSLPFEVHVIDLDRARVADRPIDPTAMFRRLDRSLTKLATSSGRTLSPNEAELVRAWSD